jgi:hypothetical protein
LRIKVIAEALVTSVLEGALRQSSDKIASGREEIDG